MAKWHFNMNVLHADHDYFDLTSILLKRVIKKRLDLSNDQKLLEIGVGSFAILSGYLSQFVRHTIDALDIRAEFVRSSRMHVELNGVNVNIFQSDLFSNVRHGKYDIIFWNLPYYQDPSLYLSRLFKDAPEYLSDKGQLVIGYNTKPLSRRMVTELLNGSALHLAEIKTWWWNLHEVLVMKS